MIEKAFVVVLIFMYVRFFVLIRKYYFRSQVTFNPQDNTQLCVVGSGIFKLFRYTEGNLKQFAAQKIDPQNYLCQVNLLGASALFARSTQCVGRGGARGARGI